MLEKQEKRQGRKKDLLSGRLEVLRQALILSQIRNNGVPPRHTPGMRQILPELKQLLIELHERKVG